MDDGEDFDRRNFNRAAQGRFLAWAAGYARDHTLDLLLGTSFVSTTATFAARWVVRPEIASPLWLTAIAFSVGVLLLTWSERRARKRVETDRRVVDAETLDYFEELVGELMFGICFRAAPDGNSSLPADESASTRSGRPSTVNDLAHGLMMRESRLDTVTAALMWKFHHAVEAIDDTAVRRSLMDADSLKRDKAAVKADRQLKRVMSTRAKVLARLRRLRGTSRRK